MDITLFFDLMSIACVLSCINVISNDKFTLTLYACINIMYLKGTRGQTNDFCLK